MKSESRLLDEILENMASMTPEAKLEMTKKVLSETKAMAWVPNPGPQTEAYYCTADELYYGGEVGGGKSELCLGLALTAHKRSLILRRLNDDARGLAERASEIVGHDNGLNRTLLKWPLGDKWLDFGGCQLETDKHRYKGRDHDLYCFDEGADFTFSQFEFITIWNRSPNPDQRCRIVVASNPPLTADGLWLNIRWAAWLDPKHPNPAQPGEIRYYLRPNDKDDREIEVDGYGPHEVVRKGITKMVRAKSRTFIRSELADNPDYAKSDYGDRLENLSGDLRENYATGSFAVGLRDAPNQVIPTAWVMEAQQRWEPQPPFNVPMVSMGVDCSGGGCFDDKTEILTDSGWKLFNDLSGTERVLSLKGDVSEWGEVTAIHKYWHDGPLNVHDGTKVNFAITDNHNLLVRTNMKSSTFKLDRYDRLAGTFAIKRGNTWSGTSPLSIEFALDRPMPNGGYRSYSSRFDFLDWAEFLGWFVSEGWVSIGKRGDIPRYIGIAQNPGPKMEKIKALLTRMGIKWALKKRGYQVQFTNTKIASFLRVECGHLAKNKRVPSHIKNGSPEVIERFLYSYHLGDGTTGNKGQKSYCTTSHVLADDIQEMLCKVGRAGKVSLRPGRLAGAAKIGDRLLGAGSPIYSMYECAKHRSATVVKSAVLRQHYTGYIYCVSTPLKTIMVRRKGCPMWSGNSDPMVIARRYDYWFDEMLETPGRDLPIGQMGKISAGIIVANRKDSALVVLDMGGGYGGAIFEKLTENEINPLSYKGTDASRARTADRQNGFFNKRSEAIWKFREALDPDQDGGSPIQLPPSQTLLADLTAPTFEPTARGIKVEPKEILVKRLGRSTNDGDAVIMAWSGGSATLAGHRISNRSRPVEIITKRTMRGHRRRRR